MVDYPQIESNQPYWRPILHQSLTSCSVTASKIAEFLVKLFSTRLQLTTKILMAIQKTVTCPHCWDNFPPYDIRWIAHHPDLDDDTKVSGGQRRFLPTMYDVHGNALDPHGEVCTELACPRCHLTIPRDLVELPTTFFSILGAPSSGKSYYLTAALYRLRTTLAQHFAVSFEDSDPLANAKVHEYEETLFLNSDESDLVALPKTEMDGELYASIEMEPGRVVTLPQPFTFRMRLLPQHRGYVQIKKNGRVFCLYDNAGEHFLPNASTANSPGTQHLSVSKSLLFVFDPTQHHVVRRKLKGAADPQVSSQARSTRQDQILTEAARRIRNERGLAPDERDKRPLIVVLTKYDAWTSLVNNTQLKKKWALQKDAQGLVRLNVPQIRQLSGQFRKVMEKYCPEVVAAADAFSEDVTFIPCSALGCSPTQLDDGRLAVNPRDVSPVWAEVPLLYALHRSIPGFIASTKAQTKKQVQT